MKKSLKYITIKGRMVARGEYNTASDEYRPYEAVTFVDEHGEEVHFSYLTISKRLDQKVCLNESSTFYIFRHREANKASGVLYAVECEGEKHFYPETAIHSITNLALLTSVRATMLKECLVISIFISFVYSVYRYISHDSSMLVTAVGTMAVLGTAVCWPFINKKNRAGIPQMYKILSGDGFSTRGVVSDKY